MNVDRLLLLRELAERGSLTAVATATHRTLSAVSQQLKVLEREAGLPLFEPAGRGVVLTDAGRALARTATDVSIAVERADSDWQQYKRQPSGVVTLTTFPSAGEMLLPGLLRRMGDVPEVSLVCSDVDPQLPDYADLTPDFDIVIADAPAVRQSWRERELTVVSLLSEPLDIALPADHRLATRSELTPWDLIGETWIGVPRDFPFARTLVEIEALTGTEANVSQRFGDNGIVEALVAGGLGIAVLPRFTTRSRGGLVTRPLSGVLPRRRIFAIMRPDRAERHSVRLVVDALRAEAQQLTSPEAPVPNRAS